MTIFTLTAPWLFVLSVAQPSDRDLFRTWQQVASPTSGPARVIGSYQAGCISGAKELKSGPEDHFVLMRPARRRHYGHPILINFLKTLSEELYSTNEDQPRFLLIGDMSPPRGGPMAFGHRSHQIGLDADLWLWLSEKRPNQRQRNTLPAPQYVVERKKLTPSFGEDQSLLVRLAAASPVVDRIFMSPPIKKFFCEQYPEAHWLYKLRPWWGHEAHIHVRLKCPPENNECESQTPLNPYERGCGEELDWWFSEEADREWQKMLRAYPKPMAFPKLPQECHQLVRFE